MGRSNKVVVAEIPDKIFDNKFPLLTETEDLIKFFEERRKPGQPKVTLLKDTVKDLLLLPEGQVLQSLIDDVNSKRHLKDDVDGWGITYYPPPEKDEKGNFTPRDVVIPPCTVGVGIRVIVMLEGKEMFEAGITISGKYTSKKILLTKEDCIGLNILLAQGFDIRYDNTRTMRYGNRNGHRPNGGKGTGKNPGKRHFLIMDGYLNIRKLSESTRKMLEKTTGMDLGFLDESDKGEGSGSNISLPDISVTEVLSKFNK